MCDLCYSTKCPYVPPQSNLDSSPDASRQSPVLQEDGGKFRDNLLTSTDAMGKALTLIPLVDVTTNALNKNGLFRNALEKTLVFIKRLRCQSTVVKRCANGSVLRKSPPGYAASRRNHGKVAFYATCYGNYTTPDLGDDFIKVFEHNNIRIELVP